jgi:hypothetical protein
MSKNIFKLIWLWVIGVLLLTFIAIAFYYLYASQCYPSMAYSDMGYLELPYCPSGSYIIEPSVFRFSLIIGLIIYIVREFIYFRSQRIKGIKNNMKWANIIIGFIALLFIVFLLTFLFTLVYNYFHPVGVLY